MYRQRNFHGRRPFFGPGPFIGGLLGGFLGSAILGPGPFYGPRPYYPPYPTYYPYYGGYGNPYW